MSIRNWVRVVLATATMLVFLPGLAGEFVWDDHTLIEQVRTHDSFVEVWSTPFLMGEHDSKGTYFRPVVSTAYLLQYRLFGESPLGFHGVSLLLHMACVLLLFGWLLRRFDDGTRKALWAVTFATALFAVHPSRPESVSWIAGATDLWMAFWVLLALWVWDNRRDWVGVVGSGFLLTLAVLSKEVAVMVPIALLLDAFFKRREGEDESWIRLFVLSAVIIGAGAIRFAVFPGAGEAPPGDAVTRVLAATGAYVEYIFWPWEPSTQVGFMLANTQGVPKFETTPVALGAVVWAGIALLTAVAFRWKRCGPWVRDTGWAFLLLIPVLQIVPLGTKWLTAYRYLYLPMMGVCALLVRLALSLGAGRVRMGVVGIGLLFLTLSTATTIVYQDVFIDERTLWTYEAQTHPEYPVVWENLGDANWKERREDEACRFWLRGYEVAAEHQNQHFQTRLALKVVRTLVIGQGNYRISDADQPRLERVRKFYDALFEKRIAAMDAEPGALKADIRKSVLAEGVAGVDLVWLPRAIVTMRTLRLDEAAAQLDAILEKGNAMEEVWARRVLVEGRRFRWREASALLNKAQSTLPGSPRLNVVAQQLEEAHKLFFQPLPQDWPEEMRKAVNQTLSLLTLGGYQQARWVLEPVLKAYPRQVLLWEARADIDRRDKRLDLMLETFIRARDSKAGPPEVWNQRIRALEAEISTNQGLEK